ESGIVIVPQLEMTQVGVERLHISHQQFKGFRRLEGGHHLDGRADHPGGVAGFRRPRSRAVGKKATETRGYSGANGKRHPPRADYTAVNPGKAVLDAYIVDKVSDGEVICPV